MSRSSIKMPLLALAFSLVLVEAMLHLAAAANPRIALLLSSGIPQEIQDDVLGQRPNPALPDHDTRGFRNTVALEHADIVTLGDSQTYGSEVSRKNAWPTLLGEELGVSTYNISLGGWGPAHYYYVVDEALALDPKVMIVALYAGNDLADAFHLVWNREDDVLQEGSPHDHAFFEQVTVERGPLRKNWSATRSARRGWFKTWADPVGKLVEEHVEIYGLIRGLSRVGSATDANVKTDSVRQDVDKYARKSEGLPPDLYFPFRVSDDVGTVFTPLARRSVADLRDPRIAEGLRITFVVLARLNERCSGACRMVVLMIPTKEFAFGEAVAEAGVDAPGAYLELVESEAALWQTIGEELDRLDVPAIDARIPLVRAIREGRNPYLADWDGHPNMDGNRVIAQYVAQHPVIAALAR